MPFMTGKHKASWSPPSMIFTNQLLISRQYEKTKTTNDKDEKEIDIRIEEQIWMLSRYNARKIRTFFLVILQIEEYKNRLLR